MASPPASNSENACTSTSHLQNEQGPSEGTATAQQPQPPGWMEDKSQMLDEVDQLVELMEDEKTKLTEKILLLEAELQETREKNTELHDRVATLGAREPQLQSEVLSLQAKLKEMEEKSIMESLLLKEALARTKEQLKDTRAKTETLGRNLQQKEVEHAKLNGSYSELSEKHKRMQTKLKETFTALQTQCSQNAKLTAELTKMQERLKSTNEEKAYLNIRLETLRKRHKHSQDEVLALKGRLTLSHKAQEQLQAKCSALEKAPPSPPPPPVVKVVSRLKEEIRLASECQRKDELLSVYVREVSMAYREQERLQNELCLLQQKLAGISENKQQLQETMKAKCKEHEAVEHELQENLHRNMSKLKALEIQERDFSKMKLALEERLHCIECELQAAMRELEQLRGELQSREGKERKERRQLEQKRQKAETLVKANREKMETLSQELASAHQQHSMALQSMSSQWEQRLREAQKDYTRLKEASTKRCAELAREVWELKSQSQNST